MKPGKVVLVLAGRYSGRKAVIVKVSAGLAALLRAGPGGTRVGLRGGPGPGALVLSVPAGVRASGAPAGAARRWRLALR